MVTSTDMDNMSFKSIEELQVSLGEQLQTRRLPRINQQRTAAGRRASPKGRCKSRCGASLERAGKLLLRVLKALDSLEGIELLAPKPTVNPLSLLRNAKVRQRVRHSRREQRGA